MVQQAAFMQEGTYSISRAQQPWVSRTDTSDVCPSCEKLQNSVGVDWSEKVLYVIT